MFGSAARAAWASPICVLLTSSRRSSSTERRSTASADSPASPDLLRSIVKQSEGEKHGGQLALLADLERSLDSFDGAAPRALA